MTKYEWERQLKKGISGLPKSEQQRVLDYYNELFADKIDAGLREQYIISEFGNPYDVANKILVDFYNGDKDNPDVDAYIYADSDDIDDAFEEEPVKTVETPKRKTWAERRDERREEHKERREEHSARSDVSADNSDNVADGDKEEQKKPHGLKSAGGLIVLICVLVYCVLGACFNLWHPSWLIFLAMPCFITLIEAINKRNWRIFAYPVFAICVFLLIGFYMHKWHPGWIIFLTIPLYYVLGDFITKNTNGTKSEKKTKARRDGDKTRSEETTARDRAETNVKSKKTKSNSNVVSVIAKILLTVCLIAVAVAVWWCVIGMFISGIGMVIGGIGCIAGAFVGTSANLLLAGAGIAVLGLGLICTFGMAALFKPCFNMCKSFVKTIKNSFDKEVA